MGVLDAPCKRQTAILEEHRTQNEWNKSENKNVHELLSLPEREILI